MTMLTLPFTYLDELVMLLDQPVDPLGVHMELRVEGRLSGTRIREALKRAAIRHPLAAARVLPARGTDRTWRFATDGAYDADPLEEIDFDTEAELDVARDRLMNRGTPFDAPPMFRAVLAHHLSGDRLILNLAHEAGDGIGMVRFLRSVQRAYADEDDPEAEVFDLVAARDMRRLLRIPDRGERKRRMKPLRRHLREATRSAPTRLAVDGGSRVNGNSWLKLRLTQEEAAEIHRKRRSGTTLNDVLIAAGHLACDRWNNGHRQTSDRIGIMMPLNMRPREWRYDVLGNYVLGVTVSTRAPERRDFASALAAVSDWTNAYKSTHGAATQVVLRPMARWPVAVKRLACRLLPERAWETAVLSNLGRVEAFGSFGPEAGQVIEHWFSPPVPPPFGVAFGTLSVNSELFISMRYRRAQFDPQAARQFIDLYRDLLLEEP